ncbi:unnamed protein product [Toxocara canis]|uniref:BZIP domain-containing protein n=1 Tax=Toxocara canis TaxID=6265 RepID=A0A183UP27_TOXCA|nr:unnamed protein product [Toxocara canis]
MYSSSVGCSSLLLSFDDYIVKSSVPVLDMPKLRRKVRRANKAAEKRCRDSAIECHFYNIRGVNVGEPQQFAIPEADLEHLRNMATNRKERTYVQRNVCHGIIVKTHQSLPYNAEILKHISSATLYTGIPPGTCSSIAVRDSIAHDQFVLPQHIMRKCAVKEARHHRSV